MRPFDLAVITARDAKQQWLFERRLGGMGMGAWARDLLVVADPSGPQPGSGGSTLYALAAALDRLGIRLEPGTDPVRAFAGRRVLLVHCGGLSQRVPQFAALGKAFAPIEPGGRTVVEAVLESLAGLAGEMPGGALVACGDVVYRGSPPASFPQNGAAAWAWPAPLEQAARHGVFQWDPHTGTATGTLQKPSVEKLRERGFPQTAPLDTGVLFLPPALLAQVLSAAMAPGSDAMQTRVLATRAQWQGLDLYGQLIPAFVTPEVSSAFPWLARVAGCGLRVFCPEDGQFLHFGTTAELLAILRPGGEREPALLNSLVRGAAPDTGPGCVLAHCRIAAALQVGEGSFLLGLDLRHGGVAVLPHLLLFSLPVTSADGSRCDVAVGMGVEDDPKAGRRATLMGKPLPEWAAHRGLSSADLWGDGAPEPERTFWNARLFPVGAEVDLDERLAWLQEAARVHPVRCGWPRLSLADIQQRFDGARWWQYEAELRAATGSTT